MNTSKKIKAFTLIELLVVIAIIGILSGVVIIALGFSGIGGCSSYQCDSSIGGGTLPPWACGDSFTDSRDGNVYTTVEIGTQCWMQKNLNYETGTSYCYDNDAENCTAYGRLYDWNTAVSACPLGWSLPTHNDWTDLERAICTSETCLADFPKDTTTTEWRGTNEGSKLSTLTLNGNNLSKFTALMSGYRDTDGSFNDVGSYTSFWSSSEGGAGAWHRALHTSGSTVYRYTDSKAYGVSVRCLKN